MINTGDDHSISVHVAQHGLAADTVNMFGAASHAVDKLRLVLQAAIHVDVNECVCQNLIQRVNILRDLRLVPQLFEREHLRGGTVIAWLRRFDGSRYRQSNEEQEEQSSYLGLQ